MARLEKLLKARREAIVAAEDACEAVVDHFDEVGIDIIRAERNWSLDTATERLSLAKRLQAGAQYTHEKVKAAREWVDTTEDAQSRQLDYERIKNIIEAKD
jgi:hypothetical protein